VSKQATLELLVLVALIVIHLSGATMNVSNEILLEELEAVKHYMEVTNDEIDHDSTRDKIIAVLNERINDLEKEVDATISAQQLGADMMMDVA
jgi:hypothetical protein